MLIFRSNKQTNMEDLALMDLMFALIPIITLYLIIDWFLRKPRVSNLNDRYVFISGCDTGFGRLAAITLAKKGCHVFAGCLTDQGLMELSNEPYDLIIPMKLDVKNIDNIERVCNIVTRLIPEKRGLWGLINNAGLTGPLGPYAWMSDTDVRHVMDVNVMGSINMVSAFLPLLKQAKGRIVNVSSILGLLNTPYSGPYCMAKHAIESFSDCLRREVYQYGISVSIIEPGGHMTPFMDKLPVGTQQAWEKLSAPLQQEYGITFLEKVIFLCTKVIPFIASNKPEDVVKAYCHALFARFPRTRYLVGRDAKVLYLTKYVPTYIMDRLFHVPGLRAVPECLTQKEKAE